MNYFVLYAFYFIFSAHPCLFVCGDDRVTRYTGADVDTGGAEDAQMAEWGASMGVVLGFLLNCNLCFNDNFGNL